MTHRVDARISRTVVVGTLGVAVMALGLAGCGHAASGFGRLTVDGQVQVTPAGGTAHAGRSGETITAGDRIQVTAGGAGVRLIPSGFLQLRAGSELTVNKTSHLTTGAVLIQPAGRSLQVSAQESTLVVPSGVAQLAVGSAATGLTAKVYQAAAQLDIPGNPPAFIAAPREIRLTPETRLPVQAAPLQYQDSDAWDHLYLAEAELISTQLAAAATGFSAQVPAGQGKDANFYQQLLPGLGNQPDFVSAFNGVEQQPPRAAGSSPRPGDYLIASAIALRGNRGPFENRLSGEMAFSAQGAPWGFVAYDQGVADLPGILSDVLGAIGRATLPVNGAPASQIAIGPPITASTTPTTRPKRPATPSVTTTTPANPRVRQPATTTTTPGPQPILQLPVPVLPGPLGALLNPLLDPLLQALNNILAGKG